MTFGWRGLRRVWIVCGTVYRVCSHMYDVLWSKFYHNFLFPFIVYPVKTYVLQPAFDYMQRLYDSFENFICRLYGSLLAVYQSLTSQKKER